MEVENYIYSEMYASLLDGIIIHLSSRGNFLACTDPKLYYKFSHRLSNLFKSCDGSKPLGNLLISNIYTEKSISEKEILSDIMTISCLIRDGVILLTNRSVSKQPKIVEDSKYYYIPSNIQMEITKACNLKCYYCYRLAGKNEIVQPIPTDQLLYKLTELANFGISSIEITGGEPTIHPDFIKIISLCYEKFVLIGLLTNGTLLDEQLIKDLEPFKDKLAISVSLDSHIPQIHDKRRGMVGAFEKTTNAIKLLSEHGFLTRVAMVIDKENWTNIEPTIILAKELGASTFGYTPILPFGRGKNSFEFWDSFVDDFLKLNAELTIKYKDFLNLHSNTDTLELQKPGGCGAGYRVYAIDPLGNVRPCVTFDEEMSNFGNIYKDKFDLIFGRESSDWFSNAIVPNSNLCTGCTYEYFCRYCILRGLTASQWLSPGKCMWLNQPENQDLSKLLQSS